MDLESAWQKRGPSGERVRRTWISRALITFFVLCPGSDALFPSGAPWTVLGKLILFGAGLLFWHSLALAMEAERQRGLRPGTRHAWRDHRHGALAGLLAGAALIGASFRAFQPASSLLFILGFLIIVYFSESARATQATKAELLEARDHALRAKLAPHFIFNTLNTLHAQIEVDPAGAQATTHRLAELFRQVVAVSDQPVIPLKQELGFVEAYLGIEQARLGSRLRVAVEVPEALEPHPIPPLSLQVLVENAVKHGIAPLERGGEVRIAARREGHALILEVSDPGNGIGAQPGTGTALETLRSRLARPEDLTLARAEGRTVASFRWRQP